jgi:hypothetical protein
MSAIWQWSAQTSQDVLERLGARRDPFRDRYVVPSERTFRRVLGDLDSDGLDLETCGFAADVVRGIAPVPVVPRTEGPVEREERRAIQRAAEHPLPPGLLPAAAIDGKAMRGARTADGGRVFQALTQDHAGDVSDRADQRSPTKGARAGRSRCCWPRWTPPGWFSPWTPCTPRRRPLA